MKEYDIILDDQKTMSFHITECEEGSWTAGPEDQGKLENYLLTMWNDARAVTIKLYDSKAMECHYLLLLPDGSEMKMEHDPGKGYILTPVKSAGKGRFSYLLAYNCRLVYKGYEGYEEYDEEECMFVGVVRAGTEVLTSGISGAFLFKKSFRISNQKYISPKKSGR